MKLTSPLDGIQQAAAPETAAKSIPPWFFFSGLVYANV